MAVQREHDVVVDYGDLAVTEGISVFDKRFDEKFYYGGDDLGAVYTSRETRFRLWAPTASEAEVVFYESWNEEKPAQILPMNRDIQGTWLLAAQGIIWGVTIRTASRSGRIGTKRLIHMPRPLV